MERVKLNETLLEIVLFIQSAESYYTSKSILFGTMEGAYEAVKEEFRGIPRELFRKAGIVGNKYNFEIARQFQVTEEMMECQADQLGQFETDFWGRGQLEQFETDF